MSEQLMIDPATDGTRTLQPLVQLPFGDYFGGPIREGDRIEKSCYNGEEYYGVWVVVKDPSGGSSETAGYCLKIISGNKRAMAGDGLMAFWARNKHGNLNGGHVVGLNKEITCGA